MLGANKHVSQPGARCTTYWWIRSHCSLPAPVEGRDCHHSGRHSPVGLTYWSMGHNHLNLHRKVQAGYTNQFVASHYMDCMGHMIGARWDCCPLGHVRGHCGRTLWVWPCQPGCFLPGNAPQEGIHQLCWIGRCVSSYWRLSIRVDCSGCCLCATVILVAIKSSSAEIINGHSCTFSNNNVILMSEYLNPIDLYNLHCLQRTAWSLDSKLVHYFSLTKYVKFPFYVHSLFLIK